MEYRFFDPGDGRLLELSELPVEGGIAIAARATGYNADEAEVLELAIVDLEGAELFNRTVKPQNAEGQQPSETTDGIAQDDVDDTPELYQFEEEISDLFENASIVAGQYLSFVENAIESSWVTLPEFNGFDLVGRFCETHCASDYPTQAASVAALDGIAGYYGISYDASTMLATARTIAACYRAFAKEMADQRVAKGDDYWKRYEERLAQEALKDQQTNKAYQLREKRMNQMNGLLWVAAGLIFISLIIQLYQRGGDVGFMVICGAFSVFAFIRAVANFRK